MDMYEFLEGFQRRMPLVAVVDSLVNRRKRKAELEDPIGDKKFENLIFSVLVFIMERTLTEDVDCDIRNIARYIREILAQYYDYPVDDERSVEITEYIVKTILQFDGSATYYPVLNYETGQWEDIRIKIIDEKILDSNKGYASVYYLTDQGYDFLFRTKEVDSELSFSVEEFKLRELIKRKNYKKALNQSNNLVQMVRQKKRDLEQFIQAAKENILDVDIGKFDDLVDSTFKLLSDEYEMLGAIQDMVKLSEKRLREEFSLSGKLMEDMKKAQKELFLINQNLGSARKEQSELINKREGSYKILITTIEDTFRYVFEKRYDFEKEIMKKMEKSTVEETKFLWKIFNPLFTVNPSRNINLMLAYSPQGIIAERGEEVETGIEFVLLSEDVEKVEAEKVNGIYIAIMESLAEAALLSDGEITFEAYIRQLMEDEKSFLALTEDNLLFITLLKLYEMETIDVRAWRDSSESILINMTDEFNIDYLLYRLQEESKVYGRMDSISFTKIPEETFTFKAPGRKDEYSFSKKVEVDNIRIKVVMNNG